MADIKIDTGGVRGPSIPYSNIDLTTPQTTPQRPSGPGLSVDDMMRPQPGPGPKIVPEQPAPAAPATSTASQPGLAEIQDEFGRQMSGEAVEDLFGVYERNPGKAVDNPKRAILDTQYAKFAGDLTGLIPTFEETIAEMGLQPPEAFDPDAAAASFRPPLRLESETREEYKLRVPDTAAAHISASQGEHILAQAAYDKELRDARAKYDERIDAILRDPSMIAELGGPNIFQAEVSGQLQKTEAEQTQLRMSASRLEETARTVHDTVGQIQQSELQRREYMEAQQQAAVKVQETLRTTRERLEAQPDPDAGRYFKSMTGGQKFLAILGSVLGGWNGGPGIPEMLMGLAEQDLQAQKATIGKRQAEVAAAQAEHAGQMDVYSHLMAQFDDERTADLAWLSLQMQDAEAMFQAELARTTVDVHKAQMYQTMVGIKAAQEDLKAQMLLRVQSVPEKIVRGGGYAIPKELRGDLSSILVDRAKTGTAVRATASGVPFEAAKTDATLNAQAQRAAAARSAKKEDAGPHPADIVASEIDAMLTKYKDNIPGRGPSSIHEWVPGTPSYDEAQAFETDAETLTFSVAKMLDPGGRLSDEDRLVSARAAIGDWTTMTDDAIRAKWNALKERAARIKKLDPDMAIRANAPMTTFQPIIDDE